MLLRRTITFLAGTGLLLGPLTQQANAPLLHGGHLTAPEAVASAPAGAPDLAPDPLPLAKRGRLSAMAVDPLLRVFTRPGPGLRQLDQIPARNPWGQRIRFLVLGARRDAAGRPWLRVLLGTTPNGSSGWVLAAHVRLRSGRDRIIVSLSARMLWHWRDGRLLQRFGVGVGAPGTPTTPGRFFVWARLSTDPHGDYGSYLLGLSGFSEVLTSWPGGGRMAIHGTDDPSDRGKPVSHGCVRVFNPQMDRLRDVPMGTPVLIRP